ncbi:DUF3800 domain-containing protein [Chryseobacterium sp. RP-3-3]|uniref:DUF3800 domain-containing protein n=1 Tax=Chryseobacterium antibioticum TaxID=2728847 RepID=A0A7Y0ANX4_9FLAO|nr:DUF3800 domain-containing protein [Chryseobacterium antibioticum]NML70806.1 DUF3800 domain-containing protein [Chryseobacterium antibioticum]
MRKIFFDEAGNTGADLLNPEQKVFTLCSNIFTENEASELASVFKNTKELHFVKLKKSQAGRRSIVKMLNHDLICENKIIIFIVDKEFATVAQIVNHLIETFYYHLGTDIHKNNDQVKFANMIYFFGKYEWDKGLYEELLNSFIEMFRLKTPISIYNFYEVIHNLYEVVNDDDKALIGPILGSQTYIEEILSPVDKFSLDVTLSTFLVLCDSWYNKLNEQFDVICDNSKQLEHYMSYIDFAREMDVPIQNVGFGSRKMTFPLQINNIKLSDSEDEFNIQISDIIASSISFSQNNKNPKYQAFVNQIKESKIFRLNNTHPLFPSHPNEIKQDVSDGQNILDFLATQSIIQMRKEKKL